MSTGEIQHGGNKCFSERTDNIVDKDKKQCDILSTDEIQHGGSKCFGEHTDNIVDKGERHCDISPTDEIRRNGSTCFDEHIDTMSENSKRSKQYEVPSTDELHRMGRERCSEHIVIEKVDNKRRSITSTGDLQRTVQTQKDGRILVELEYGEKELDNTHDCPDCGAAPREECDRCGTLAYCSTACLYNNWGKHKPLCDAILLQRGDQTCFFCGNDAKPDEQGQYKLCPAGEHKYCERCMILCYCKPKQKFGQHKTSRKLRAKRNRSTMQTRTREQEIRPDKRRENTTKRARTTREVRRKGPPKERLRARLAVMRSSRQSFRVRQAKAFKPFIASLESQLEPPSTKSGLKHMVYNCNGIRALHKKGRLRQMLVKHNPDVVALSEIKIGQKKLRGLKSMHLMLRALGYKYCYWHPMVGRGGLHGVALLCKIEPLRVFCGWMHKKLPDDDGRVITAIFETHILIQTYVPCSTWPMKKMDVEKARQKDERRRQFDTELKDHCAFLKALGLPIIHTGDMNVTATDADVNMQKPFLDEYPGHKPWERAAFAGKLQELDFVDAWRHFYPTPSKADFTQWEREQFWAAGKGQRIDYVLATPDLLYPEDKQTSIYIGDMFNDQSERGSDHCPMFFQLYNARQTVTKPDVQGMPLAPMATDRQPLTIPEVPDMSDIPVLPMMTNATMSTEPMDDVAVFDVANYPACVSEPQEYSFDRFVDSITDTYMQSITDTRYADVAELRSCSSVHATVPVSDVCVDRSRGISLRALWDSGASYTVMSRTGLDYLRKKGVHCAMKSAGDRAPTFVLADGTSVCPAARVCISVHFGTQVVVHHAWLVEGGEFDLILGVDFFVRTGAVMSFVAGAQAIELTKLDECPTVPFQIETDRSTFRGAVSPLFAPATMVMKARTRRRLNLRVLDSDPVRAAGVYDGIVERHGAGEDARHCLATALSRAKSGLIFCELANFTQFDAVVPKGALLGYFRPMETVDKDVLDQVRTHFQVMEPIPFASFDDTESEDRKRDGVSSQQAGMHGHKGGSSTQQSGPDAPEITRASSQGNASSQQAGMHGHRGESSTQQSGPGAPKVTRPGTQGDVSSQQAGIQGGEDEESTQQSGSKTSELAERRGGTRDKEGRRQKIVRMRNTLANAATKPTKKRKAHMAATYLDELVPPKEDDPIDEHGIPTSLRPKLEAAKKVLSDGQFARLEALVREFADVFARDYSKPTKNKFRALKMHVDETKMKVDKQRRYSPKERALIKEYCTKLLKADVLEMSESPWRSNLILVPKKDSGFRICVDMRTCNAATETIASNLPCLADNLDLLGGKKIFSTFDILSAFWSCDLYEPHRKYTSFFAPGLGNLQFKRAAMGMCNSGTHFVSLTLDMFSDVLFEYVAAYADDILVFSEDIDDHIDIHLRKVLERLREYDVKLKGTKAELCVTSLEWCGYRISTDGIRADPKKIAAIVGMKDFKTLKQLRSFLGSCNFLRRWIAGYADIIQPLRPLLQKGRFRQNFTKEQRDAIDKLKEAITSAPVLAHPRFDRPFHVYCDASTVALGAALCQKNDKGDTVVIAYLSKNLTKTQQGYHVNELEALSVLYALETWSTYFFGQPSIQVFTDSDAACWLFKPDSKYTGRALRWMLRASRWPVKLTHLPGATNKLADMLSRCPSDSQSQEPRTAPAALVSMHLRAMTRARRRAMTVRREAATVERSSKMEKQRTQAPGDRRQTEARGEKETPRCFNCKRRHVGGEVECKEHCRLCNSPGHTRVSCPKKDQMRLEDEQTQERPVEGERQRNPWETLFPNYEFEDEVLALRPDIVLWHKTADKRAVFRQHQDRDVGFQRVRAALEREECHEECAGVNGHSRKCIHSQWRLSPDGLLTRCILSAPLKRDAALVSILNELDNSLCCCSKPRCHDSCPHLEYYIEEKGDEKKSQRTKHGSEAGASGERLPRETAQLAPSYVPTGVIRPNFGKMVVRRRSFRLAVPESLKTSVLYHVHGSGVAGHPGTTRAIHRAKRRFWWKGMDKDIRRWVGACLPCQQRKPPRPKNVGTPGRTELPEGPMQEIYIDFAGKFPETDRGNKWILSIVCAYSRYPIAVPLPNRSAPVLVRALLEHVVQHYSCPKLIVSDAAREFIGKDMEDFCKVFDIEKHTNPAYSPALSSYVERYHAWQGACLSIITSRFKKDWDLMLPLVSLAYRTTIHSSLGITPFEALHGFEPRMPFDSWCPWGKTEAEKSPFVRDLQVRMREIYGAIKDAHDAAVSKNVTAREKTHRVRPFEPGEFVLRYAPKTAEALPDDIPNKPKLNDRWSLPGLVVAKGDRGLIIVQGPDGKLTNERADTLVRYRFFSDDIPSLPPKRKFTKQERAARNKAAKQRDVRKAKVGDMVCFPMEMRDGPGFGIGKVLYSRGDGTFNIHFYSNDTESLLGTYKPCWLNTEKKWYSGAKRHASHTPMVTDKYFPSPIRQKLFAAVGFNLMEDDRLPMPVLRAMSAHPDYQWSLPDEEE